MWLSWIDIDSADIRSCAETSNFCESDICSPSTFHGDMFAHGAVGILRTQLAGARVFDPAVDQPLEYRSYQLHHLPCGQAVFLMCRRKELKKCILWGGLVGHVPLTARGRDCFREMRCVLTATSTSIEPEISIYIHSWPWFKVRQSWKSMPACAVRRCMIWGCPSNSKFAEYSLENLNTLRNRRPEAFIYLFL